MRFTQVALKSSCRSWDRDATIGSRRLRRSQSRPVVESLETRELLAALQASAAGIYPPPSTLVPFTGIVATFSDTASGQTSPSDFQATINWGDGHTSSGIIGAPANAGYFTVAGSNTYAVAGTYTLTVTVTDNANDMSTANPTVTVGNVPATVTGFLDPASISGPNKSLNITNINRPTFDGVATNAGMAAAFAVVQLFAQPSGATQIYLGQTIAGPDGSWSLTAPKLADGVYTISASVTSAAGFPSAPSVIVGAASPLVIDTVAPRVAGLAFDPHTGVITAVISDSGSGLYLPSLEDPSNYTIMLNRTLGGSHPTQQALAPAISGFYSNAQSATLQFNAPLAAGRYLFMIQSGGVMDQAGNALDGEFTGTLPSGNGQAGGNFIVALNVPRAHFPKPRRTGHQRLRTRL
jgi:Bacterial Ig-like domain